jgi:hypothetical protein
MNKVWIVSKTIEGGQEYFLATDSEFKGLKQALAEIIQEFIHCDSLWDKTNVLAVARSHHIYLRAKSNNINDLREALYLYNSFQKSKQHQWEVFSTNIQEPALIQDLDDSFFDLNECEKASAEEIAADLKIAEVFRSMN